MTNYYMCEEQFSRLSNKNEWNRRNLCRYLLCYIPEELRFIIGNINILHLVPDEKFIDVAYRSFESVAPLCNTFLIPSWDKKLKYIKETPVQFINPFSFKNPYFMRSLERYDFIVLHSLNTFNQRLIANTNLDLKFIWIGYGYDYYDLIFNDCNGLYQEETKAIVKSLIPNENNSVIGETLKRIAQKIFYKNLNKKKIIEKINFFSPVLENEYELVASTFGSSFPRYIAWNYGSQANIMDKIMDKNMKNYAINGNNILVGNSATPTNNHIEIFDFLKTQDLTYNKIICPLSYGDSEYAKIIKNKGETYFGENFLGLDTFIPYDKYVELIGNCSNVIMNHHRQQAVGNIVVMLFMGANVFLNKINPFYSFLKEKGAVIYTMDELFDSPDLLDSHLSEEDIEQNQRILMSLYGEKAIQDKTESLILEVMSSKEK